MPNDPSNEKVSETPVAGPKKGMRRPLGASTPGVLIFQQDQALSPSIGSEFQKRGVKLAQVTVPLPRCIEEELVATEIQSALKGIGDLELVLAFADHIGPEGELSKMSVDMARQIFSANVVSLKVFFDELFKTGKHIRQISVITLSSEATSTSHPGFEVAVAGLEMMVKLYALEREATHFSVIALHKPWTDRSDNDHVARTIQEALKQPSGVLLDEHGRTWKIVHATERENIVWKNLQ